jgi:hypothetical protein
MEEADIKHLEFVQAVIARQAGNSFLLKGWSITVAVALFAFAAKDSDPRFAILALFPALAFWSLDAYYLRQERLYRELYEHVRLGATGGTRTVMALCMSTKTYRKVVDSWFATLFTPSVLLIHITVIVVVGFVYAYLAKPGGP